MLVALSNARKMIVLFVCSSLMLYAPILRSQSQRPAAAVDQEGAAAVAGREEFSEPSGAMSSVPSVPFQSEWLMPWTSFKYLNGGEIQMEPGLGGGNTAATCQSYVVHLEAYVRALEAKLAGCQCGNPPQ